MKSQWIRKPKGAAANIVFVHGVFSNGETCWAVPRSSLSWPKLIEADPDLASTGIYVCSYHTGFFSGGYRLSDVVAELRQQFLMDGVLDDTDNVVFVCHSMGGIVIRKFLVDHAHELVDLGLTVGLFLVASPSLGSTYANWLRPLIYIIRNAQAESLRFSRDNPWLEDLARNFKDLLDSKRLPIVGKEIIEDRAPILGAFARQIVEPFSAAAHFPHPLKIPKSDHSSIAKPSSSESLQHKTLCWFVRQVSSDNFDPPDQSPEASNSPEGFDGVGSSKESLVFPEKLRGRAINAPARAIRGFYEKSKGTFSRQTLQDGMNAYFRWVQERNHAIELRGVESGGAAVIQLPLSAAYVPLAGASANNEVELTSLFDFGNRIAVTGGPGSGKSTTLMHVAWSLASHHLGDLDTQYLQKRACPIPILLPLAGYARYLRSQKEGQKSASGSIADYAIHFFRDNQVSANLPPEFISFLFESGRDLLLLLDGLDEIADELERYRVRQAIESFVQGRSEVVVVVTCRSVAYRMDRTALGAQFMEVTVKPLLMNKHVRPMIERAYECIYPANPFAAKRRAESLIDEIGQMERKRQGLSGRRIPSLVNSPLMVRLSLIVHMSEKILPDDRADLYEKATQSLLRSDYKTDEESMHELASGWTEFRDMAQCVAFEMHGLGPEQGKLVSEETIRSHFSSYPELENQISGFLDAVKLRGSLIEERDGTYRFCHLSFQEFLVARHIYEDIGFSSRDGIMEFLCANSKISDPWWREPILLLIGFAASRYSKNARYLIERLRKLNDSMTRDTLAALGIAGEAVMQWRQCGTELRNSVANRIVEVLGSWNKPGLEYNLRRELGFTLYYLGDPRFDIRSPHLPTSYFNGFVFVDTHEDCDSDDLCKVGGDCAKVKSFYVSRYLVTVEQFQEYLSGANERDRSWSSQGVGDANRIKTIPVTGIGLGLAVRYCEWLAEVIVREGGNRFKEIADLLGNGWELSIPKEAEWDFFASVGITNQIDISPHGPEPVSQGSVVGCDVPNVLRIHDLGGNCWELTCSAYSQDICGLAEPTLDRGVVVKNFVDGQLRRELINPLGSAPDLGFRIVIRRP